MPGKAAESLGKIKEKINANKGLAVLVSVLVILGSAWILYSLTLGSRQAAPTPVLPVPALTADTAQAEPATGDATVLPQQERETTGEEEVTAEEDLSAVAIPRNPFASPPALVGIILCSQENHLAIVESGNHSYILAKGELMDGTWEVIQIAKSHVVLFSKGKSMLLNLK